MNVELQEDEQKTFMFRKDTGTSVSASECTTKCKKYLCIDCEKRLRPIDHYANAVWRYLFIDNSFLEHSQIDLKAVLFSIMARGMYISLPEVPNNLLHAFDVMKIDMGIGTY